MSLCLGLDTSNYTTSVALFDGRTGCNLGRLLEVPSGALGLRQSDALFQHVKRLPALFEDLRSQGRFSQPLSAVGASTRPRAVEGSYMPCFLAGSAQGRVLADTLGVPFFECSHQQGHIAAAAWSAGAVELLDRPHLAWHLSGGTTELLYVEPSGRTVKARPIGGASDISAGQLIDRAGVLLGLDFPAGKALDELCREGEDYPGFPVKLKDFTFSLSGMENKVKALVERGAPSAQVAGFVLNTVADVVLRTTVEAEKKYPGLPVLCSGGVASNARLRAVMGTLPQVRFAKPRYATDNALGVAVLTHRALEGGEPSA